MRLPVQGYLILLLGLFSTHVMAGPDFFETSAEAMAACEARMADKRADIPTGNPWNVSYGCTDHGVTYPDDPPYVGLVKSQAYRDGEPNGGVGLYRYKIQDCETLPHEPDPDNPDREITQCGLCEATHHDMGADFEQTGPNQYRCELKEDLSECREKGEHWHQIGDEPFGSEGYCRPECDGTSFEGACLEEDEDSCTADSDDYQGTIGWGESQTAVCSGESQCGDGETFGIIDTGDGTQKACIPDDLGPPTCDADGVLIMDDYGFVCESPEGGPEDEEDQEEPNTDTDGDGEPDEYDRGNDPDAGNKQRDDMIDGIEGTNDRLDKIGEGIGSLDEGLEGIEDAIGDLGDTPDGGFSIDSLTDAVPTMGESFSAFGESIAQTQVAEFANGLVNIPAGAACPVYTMPGTEYWDAMSMSLHCEILEDYSGLFEAMFMFFWTGTAVFLFLRA